MREPPQSKAGGSEASVSAAPASESASAAEDVAQDWATREGELAGNAGVGGEADAGLQAVVEDDAPIGAGQMGRSLFLSTLRSSVSAAAAEILGPLLGGSCPYLDEWFARHAGDNAGQLDRLARRYTGLTAEAGATEYIAAVSDRLRESIRRWSRGEASIPELVAGAGVGDGDETVLTWSAEGGPGAAQVAGGAIARLGPGEALDGGVRARLGRMLGHPVPEMRLHRDATAAGLARDAGAHAFTLGAHVALGANRYQPGTLAGDFLLAHEAAHVAQQTGGHGRSATGVSSAAAERDATQATVAAARAWLGGGSAPAREPLLAPLRLQRCKDCGTSRETPRVNETTPPQPRAGQKTLRSGRMQWNLEPAGTSSADMTVRFFPTPEVRARARSITFLQTVTSTVDGNRITNDPAQGDFGGSAAYADPTSGARVDFILTPGGEMPEDWSPFYGADWSDSEGRWVRESEQSFPWQAGGGGGGSPSPAPAGSGSGSGSAAGSGSGSGSGSGPAVTPTGPSSSEAAQLHDHPMSNLADGLRREFETVAVIPETGEILGSLRWSFEYTRNQGRQFTGATEADCTDGPTPAFQQTVERFYTARYTTLAAFPENDATLTDAHRATLDAFIAQQRNRTEAIRIQGFATSGETDPRGVARQRATAVQGYLTRNGIAAGRVTIEAYGASWARVPVANANSGAQNRRVQIAVSGR